VGEESQVKERRVTWRESTTFAWVFKNSIPPELSQIESFSSYIDSAHPVPADHASEQRWERLGGRRGKWRRSIECTITKRVEDTEDAQWSGVGRWKENLESTQLRGFAGWRGKKYSYWLSCTHITRKISTILP